MLKLKKKKIGEIRRNTDTSRIMWTDAFHSRAHARTHILSLDTHNEGRACGGGGDTRSVGVGVCGLAAEMEGRHGLRGRQQAQDLNPPRNGGAVLLPLGGRLPEGAPSGVPGRLLVRVLGRPWCCMRKITGPVALHSRLTRPVHCAVILVSGWAINRGRKEFMPAAGRPEMEPKITDYKTDRGGRPAGKRKDEARRAGRPSAGISKTLERVYDLGQVWT